METTAARSRTPVGPLNRDGGVIAGGHPDIEGGRLSACAKWPASAALAALLLLAGAGWVWSAPSEDPISVHFTAGAFLSQGFGGTAYDLSSSAAIGGVTSLSRLEFPQVQTEAGVRLSMSLNRAERRDWLFAASYEHSVFDFHGQMNDYDWSGISGYPPIPWSYTYSQDSTVAWQASGQVERRLFSLGPWSFSLYGSFLYQYAYHVENGLTGWQYDWNKTKSAYDLYTISDQTKDVLEYTLSSAIPGVGLMVDVRVFPWLRLELRGAYLRVYMADRDNHVLRTKLSTAAGWGNGASVDLATTVPFGKPTAALVPYIALDGNYLFYSVSTTQTQYWYGNADASNGAPQGTTYYGIGHVVTSNQFQVRVRFGLAF